MSERDPSFFDLHGLDPGALFAHGLDAPRPQNVAPMILRVSAAGKIRYINVSFATYLGSTVEELTGQPIEAARQLCSPQVAECIDLQTASMAAGGLVTDATGRVFEPLISLEAGVLDVILSEVTPGSGRQDFLQSLTGVALAEMDETEFRTFRSPKKSDVSILAVRIHGLDALARSQTLHDMRILLDVIEEETIRVVTSFSGTVAGAGIGCFLGIFGAPRHFPDHALRAALGAAELRRKIRNLAASFAEDGKSFPVLGLAIWSGEVLTGALGGQRLGAYSAIGAPVQAALELGSLAGEGEILIAESSLAEITGCPTEGWVFQSVRTESEPDLSNFQWAGSTIVPLSPELSRVRCEMVPEASPDGPAYFTFEYLWSLQPAGAEESVPIARLLNGEQAASPPPLRAASGEVQSHVLGRYKLLNVLGAGGMGKVWLAKDRFGHPVAIKVLNTQGTPTADALKRFRREGEAMAKLRHRSICRIYEMNEVDGISFIAMEYVGGVSLSGLLASLPKSGTQKRRAKSGNADVTELIRAAKQGSIAAGSKERTYAVLPTELALTLFLKICEAVQFAHEHGVLHRDLKPANILLREDGEPLVADFGLAKFADGEDQASLSMTGNVVGTLQNMAPEQADSSKHVDERADIYSLGTILYQMLTGRPHFAATGNIVIDGPKLQEHQPIRPRIRNPAIDADLETITLKCLRIDPARRYRSVRSLWEDLDRYRRGEPIAARPVSPVELLWKQIRRHKTVAALSAGFVIVLGFGAVAAFWQISQRAEAAQAAAEEAGLQRKEAEAQRQLALLSKKDAQEKQVLAERREQDARQSAEAAQAREKEAQDALAALRKAEAETVKESQLRKSAEENAKTAEQLRLAAESQAKGGFAPEPKLSLREQYLRKGMSLTEGAEYYRSEVEKALTAFRAAPAPVAGSVVITYGPQSFPGGHPGGGNSNARQQNTWSSRGRLPADLVSRITHIDGLLSLYSLCDPRRGLPLLLNFKLCVFDVGGAVLVADAMKRRGMEPHVEIDLKEMVSGIRLKLDDLRKRGLLRAELVEVRDQVLRSVQFNTSTPLPATIFSQSLVQDLSGSDITTAAALANWDAEAVVNFRATGSFGRATTVVATGRGVVTLNPLFSRYMGTETMDISYSSVPSFPKVSTSPPQKLIARHSALREFEQENGRVTGFIAHIKELDLSFSSFTAIHQLIEFPFIVRLSIVGIPVADAAGLFSTDRSNHNLEDLDIAGVPISSFAGIPRFERLESLRFSPDLLQDKASISELRKMKLKSISTPHDESNQNAMMFWEKWDRGEYDQ